jgi:hypothetical protein
MAAKSDFLRNAMLNLLYGATSFTPLTTVYVALFTGAPTAIALGAEVSGGGYTRVAVVNNATNFPAAVLGVKTNGTTILFPTATQPWGTLVAFALFDAPTGGNMLHFGTLPSIVVGMGATPGFSAGELSITES